MFPMLTISGLRFVGVVCILYQHPCHHTRSTSRNTHTTVYLQIHYTKLEQLVYLGANRLYHLSLVDLRPY